ncbi:MAG TPA: hypothetical protein VGB56_12675 [Flavisolibacter sp.]|jgi:antitoxin component YwqK of YwqJK toxin-antitoxin module
MKPRLLLLTLLANCTLLHAQKKEEGFNHAFKPTENSPRYYVVTEKKDSGWLRIAYYLPERTQAMECMYRDAGAKIPHGNETWFFPNKQLKWTGRYVDGKKEGTWLRFDSAGRLSDSSNYSGGKRKGVQFGWHANGYPSDSAYFDGAGNGVEYNWTGEGLISSTGRWVRDTSKQGKWNYYYPDGKVRVSENYKDGQLISRTCFNEAGTPLDSAICTETEATAKGGISQWIRYLERSLNSEVPVKNRAPYGTYEVAVQFVVDIEGKIIDISPLTRFGYGMEEEVVRVLKNAPTWAPAEQFGRKVKAYRIQPFTFVVSKD